MGFQFLDYNNFYTYIKVVLYQLYELTISNSEYNLLFYDYGKTYYCSSTRYCICIFLLD